MKTMNLYTGGGVSLSPQDGEGRTKTAYIRLVADDGKCITDGNIVTTCIDTNTPEKWSDCDTPTVEQEAGPEDYEQALEEMGVDFSD